MSLVSCEPVSFSLTLKFNAPEAIAIDCLLRRLKDRVQKSMGGRAVAWLWAVAVAVRLFYNMITRHKA